MKRIFAVAVFGLITTTALAETTVRDVSSALGQVSRIFGGGQSATSKGQFVAPGTRVKLDDGRISDVYGFECAPSEPKPCGSIKVDNGSHRVMVVPVSGQPFEERWTFRKLNNGNLIFVRPKGQFVTAAQ